MRNAFIPEARRRTAAPAPVPIRASQPSASRRARPHASVALTGALLGALALLASGCVARAQGGLVYDYPVVTVDTVPVGIEAYPRTYYRGREAYLVDGRWYYRSPRGWVVFREEPVELRRYRTQYRDGHGNTYRGRYRGADPVEIDRRRRPMAPGYGYEQSPPRRPRYRDR